MCWVTHSEKKPEIQKAESDIKVAKFLLLDDDGNFLAPYFRQEYRLGEVVKADAPLRIKELDVESWYANEGLHSYSPDCIVGRDEAFRFKIYPNDGEKSFVLDYWDDVYGIPCSEKPGTVCIMSARIPKGADYCKNEYGEYISSHLVIDKFVCMVQDLLLEGEVDGEVDGEFEKDMTLNEIFG